MQNKIKVISHRGSNKYAPQNTMIAFEKSIEIGTDGFETDVHFSKDGELVICHNYNIDETSDGKGDVKNLTLEQLRRYDFGKYFSPKFVGTKIPTLREFLQLAKDNNIEVINVEIKAPKDGSTEIVKATIDLAKEIGVFDNLLISSFGAHLLKEAKKIDKNCQTGFLYSPAQNFNFTTMNNIVEYCVKGLGVDAIHPYKKFVTQRMVDDAHRNGLKVNVWTINTPSEYNKMIKIGVDGLITDQVDVAKGMLSKYF